VTDPLGAALLAAWNAAEPELPECHLCGNDGGPWVPEPSGDRWPSGAQKLVCKGGCEAAKGVHTMDTPGGGVVIADAPGGEKGTQIVGTPGGRRLAPLSVRMDAQLSDDLAVMARAGLNASDAVRVALGIVAGTYANAWAAGAVPEGVPPDIAECVIRTYDGPPAL
jgi:hypothetical protein